MAVQGGLDYICPPRTALALREAWPEMELRLVLDAGHSMYDPRIASELVRATDQFRDLPPPPPPSTMATTTATAATAASVVTQP